MSKHRKYAIWTPVAVSTALATVTLVYYATRDYSTWLTVAKIVIAALIPALLPSAEIVFRKKFPIHLNLLISSHIVFSVYLGSGFGFYSLIPLWDMFLHGYFGLVGAAVLFALFAGRLEGVGIIWTSISVFLSVMGCAALWEIFEFTTDAIFNQDAQCVLEAMAVGKNPIADTMSDIIITAPGALLFLVPAILVILNKKRKNR